MPEDLGLEKLQAFTQKYRQHENQYLRHFVSYLGDRDPTEEEIKKVTTWLISQFK